MCLTLVHRVPTDPAQCCLIVPGLLGFCLVDCGFKDKKKAVGLVAVSSACFLPWYAILFNCGNVV